LPQSKRGIGSGGERLVSNVASSHAPARSYDFHLIFGGKKLDIFQMTKAVNKHLK